MKYRMLVVAVAAVAVSANAHVVWQIGQTDGGCLAVCSPNSGGIFV